MIRKFAALGALIVVAACDAGLVLPAAPRAPGPGTVSGRLVASEPGTGRVVPVAGASVQLLSTNVSAVTGADGFFLLAPIHAPRGRVLVRHDADGDGEPERQRLLALDDYGAKPGRDVALGDLSLRDNATIRGRALRSDRAGDRRGHGGIAVFVPEGPFTALSGDDGSFVLPNVPEGTLTLSFFRAGYLPAELDALAVRAGEAVSLRDVVLAPAPGDAPARARISGRVRLDPAADDASAAKVVARSAVGEVPLAVARDGVFAGEVPLALYNVELAHEGHGRIVVANVLVATAAEHALPDVVLAREQRELPQPEPTPDPGAPPVDPNEPPIASVATAPVARALATHRLDASASRAPQDRPLFFSWRQTAGEEVRLSANDSVLASAPTFVAPESPQRLRFDLTVRDAATGLEAGAAADVEVVAAPVARISPPALAVRPGSRFVLDGSASGDPSGAPITYEWTVAGAVLAEGERRAPAITLAAPLVEGTVTAQLVVSNGFVASSPTIAVVDVRADAAVPPLVEAGRDVVVDLGATVSLDGRATHPNPDETLSYLWTQEEGAPVTLVGAQSAKASFVAPVASAQLVLRLTVTTGSGASATDGVRVEVQDRSPPRVVATDPPEGLTGSWMHADVRFDEALDPITVTPSTVGLRDAAGEPVASRVRYDGASRTVRILPDQPLAGGATYTLRVEGVKDLSPLRNALTPAFTRPVTVRAPQWALWTGPEKAEREHPGLVAVGLGAQVLSISTASRCVSVFDPGADGRLQQVGSCLGVGWPETGHRVGTVAGESVFAFFGTSSVLRRAGGTWRTGFTTPARNLGTDGRQLFAGAPTADWMSEAFAWDEAGGAWRNLGVFEPSGRIPTDVTGREGRPITVSRRAFSNDPKHYVQVRERAATGAWNILPGGSYRDGTHAQSANVTIVRIAMAKGEPLVVYAHVDAALPRVSAVSLAANPALEFPDIHGTGAAGGELDVRARGSTAFVAFVTDGRLRVRRLDLDEATPAWVDVPGPDRADLNADPACTAFHPELGLGDDAVHVTWEEHCPATQKYRVYLRSLR